MEKNKRNKIIGLSIGILVVLIIVVSSTYAYWQITRTQTTPNDIVAACLNLDLNDASTENTGINLDSAWPISDEEGKSLAGYTFTVTNNCNEEINYIVGLNRVEEETANYLLDSSIKLQLDDNSSFTYSDLSDVEYADAENTEYTSRVSKQVSVETIGAKGTSTHTLRVWISEDSPVTEQSKTFLGQVFITGGQGITVPETSSCFTITDAGTIVDYDYSCGTDVVVPAEINGIQVKEIDGITFFDAQALMLYAHNSNTEEDKIFILINDVVNKEKIKQIMLEQFFCEGKENCAITDLSQSATVFDTLDEYIAYDWSGYDKIVETFNFDFESEALYYLNSSHNVTSVDLSETIYLETIGNSTFCGYYNSEECEIPLNPDNSNSDECKSTLESVTLPQNGNLKTIGYYAFAYNTISTNIEIPSTTILIREMAFENNNISSVVIQDTVEKQSQLNTIGDFVFRDNNLSGVFVIPGSVTTIGSAFSGNPNLTEIVIKREDSTGMNLSSGWNGSITVTYNPNYTE